jgi:AraC-like DNA-binding protein
LSDAFDYRAAKFASPEEPSRQWLDWFCEEFGRKHFKVDMQPDRDAAFRLSGVNRMLPDLGLYHGQSSPAVCRNLVSDATNNDVTLIIPIAGNISFAQAGGDVSFKPGAVIAGREDVANVFTTHSDSEFALLRLRRRMLEALVPDLDDLCYMSLPIESQAVRLLLGYLRTLDAEESISSPELQHLTALHVHDLAAQALQTLRTGNELAETGGVRAGRRAEVKTDILSHLADPRLSVAAVAARLNLTPRYIHMLLEDDEETFSEFVVGQRLARAYRMLTDLRFADRTIGAIALDVGFSDLSYFNRTFRRRFGATPSEVRETARRRT